MQDATDATTSGNRPSWRGRSTCSAGSAARTKRRSRRYLATEEGRRAVLVTLVGDVASSYFLLRELDLQLEIARGRSQLNDETVTYFQNRLEGGVSNRLEVEPGASPTGR